MTRRGGLIEAKTKDVVVLLPGILGSALARDGVTLWDTKAGALGRALITLGDSVQQLALGSDASQGEGVTATALLEDAHMIPYLWKIDGYSEAAAFLTTHLGLTPGENFFEFPYDWRLDNRISARRLRARALDWLERWRERSGHADARLVLVAHSMGGLVSRYFVECFDGWRHTRLLVTLGTPHRGSVKALDFLFNGVHKRLGPITLVDLTDLLRSLPSVHQLLPIYPCVSRDGGELARIEELAELGDVDLDRAVAGIGFHREIESAVEKNRADADYLTSGYRLLPVVGTYQPTYLSALLTADGLRPLRTYRGREMQGGDGTVPRFSATPIEMSGAHAEVFVPCPHAALQNFASVRVQVRAALEDLDIAEIKAVAPEPISLELDDLHSSAQRFEARACCAAAIDPMRATVTDVESGESREAEMVLEAGDEGWQRLELAPLPAGTYRLRVEEAEGEAEPVEDVFLVLDEC